MAETANPTNQRVVELLERILDELSELRQAQERLVAEVVARS